MERKCYHRKVWDLLPVHSGLKSYSGKYSRLSSQAKDTTGWQKKFIFKKYVPLRKRWCVFIGNMWFFQRRNHFLVKVICNHHRKESWLVDHSSLRSKKTVGVNHKLTRGGVWGKQIQFDTKLTSHDLFLNIQKHGGSLRGSPNYILSSPQISGPGLDNLNIHHLELPPQRMIWSERHQKLSLNTDISFADQTQYLEF